MEQRLQMWTVCDVVILSLVSDDGVMMMGSECLK